MFTEKHASSFIFVKLCIEPYIEWFYKLPENPRKFLDIKKKCFAPGAKCDNFVCFSGKMFLCFLKCSESEQEGRGRGPCFPQTLY